MSSVPSNSNNVSTSYGSLHRYNQIPDRESNSLSEGNLYEEIQNNDSQAFRKRVLVLSALLFAAIVGFFMISSLDPEIQAKESQLFTKTKASPCPWPIPQTL